MVVFVFFLTLYYLWRFSFCIEKSPFCSCKNFTMFYDMVGSNLIAFWGHVYSRSLPPTERKYFKQVF